MVRCDVVMSSTVSTLRAARFCSRYGEKISRFTRGREGDLPSECSNLVKEILHQAHYLR